MTHIYYSLEQKYEETPDDDAVHVEAEDDFSPPTESTPNEQKSSAPSQEAVSNVRNFWIMSVILKYISSKNFNLLY